jgi:hypothetical protein
MRHNAHAILLVSCLVPLAAHAGPASAPCNLLDQQMLAALNLGDADTRVEHKAVAATAHATAQRIDTCTFTPHVGNTSTLSVMSIALAPGSPPGKPVCTEKSEAKVGMASCNVVARDSIVTVSLVSRRAGFETLSTALRTHFERLFTPGGARQ